MEIQNLIDVVVQEAWVMVPALMALGYLIKHTSFVDSRLIPPVLTIASLVLTPLILGGFDAPNVVQAIVVAALAVYAHQVYVQSKELKEDK